MGAGPRCDYMARCLGWHPRISPRVITGGGARDRPSSKLLIKVDKGGCVYINRADIDGTTLMLYAQNDCHGSLDYLEWHWKLLSPDGTALKEGYTNQCPKPDHGHSSECVFSEKEYTGVPDDDRASAISVWLVEK